MAKVIVVKCKSCGKKMSAPISRAGKTGNCPGCGKTIRVPMPKGLKPPSKATPAAPPPPPSTPTPASLPPADSTPQSWEDDEYKIDLDMGSPAGEQQDDSGYGLALQDPDEAGGASEPAAPSFMDDVLGESSALPESGAIPSAPPPPADPAPSGDPQAAMLEHDYTRPDRTCPSCSSQLPSLAMVCLQCGYNLQTGKKVVLSERGGSSSPLARLPWVKIIGFLIIATVGGGIWYWWATGPGKDVFVNRVERVDTYTLFDRMLRLKPVDIVASKGPNGKPVLTVKGPLPGMTSYKNFVSLGGHEQLVLARPNPKGSHLLIEIAISQRLMNELKQVRDYKLFFNGGQFELQSPSGAKLKGGLLKQQFDNKFAVALTTAKTSDPKVMIPAGFEPSEHQKQQAGRVETGHIAFDGTDGVKGRVDYKAYIKINPFDVSGLSGNGKITVKDANGTKIDATIKYLGGSAIVAWDGGSEGWRGVGTFEQAEDMSPYNKTKITLLIELPKGVEGECDLIYVNRKIATIDVP